MAKKGESAYFTLLERALGTSYIDAWDEFTAENGIFSYIIDDFENAGYGERDKSRSKTLTFLNSVRNIWDFLAKGFRDSSDKLIKELRNLDRSTYDTPKKVNDYAEENVDRFYSKKAIAQVDRLIENSENFRGTLISQSKSTWRKWVGHKSKFANEKNIAILKKLIVRLKEIKTQKLLEKALVRRCIQIRLKEMLKQNKK